jgi:hypothetical protein
VAREALLTTAQAAERLHVTQHLMEVWRTRERGPRFVKVGAHVFYRAEDLAEFVGGTTPQQKHKASVRRVEARLRDARERRLGIAPAR